MTDIPVFTMWAVLGNDKSHGSVEEYLITVYSPLVNAQILRDKLQTDH